jgi:hypothetical protein
VKQPRRQRFQDDHAATFEFRHLTISILIATAAFHGLGFHSKLENGDSLGFLARRGAIGRYSIPEGVLGSVGVQVTRHRIINISPSNTGAAAP